MPNRKLVLIVIGLIMAGGGAAAALYVAANGSPREADAFAALARILGLAGLTILLAANIVRHRSARRR